MLLGHVGLIPLTGEALGLEHIDPAVVKRVLGRTSRYPTKDERDAEALATYLRSYAGRWTPAPRPRPGDNADARVIDRISATLAGDRRWWR
ncbi:hypothetical protein SAMN05421812_12566 [Asanoa hainanensis]|uniref:Uncharacterized protein n=3 Tax=Micromonosporaceae TaxID=28056 RepID=A0A239PFD9_9ACTN|nr:hypothetical protein Asi02nite_37270 [Asanoa siamensis]SNT65723.1 hypothetical protein SAMN05421812_12566 [Asanoa hainanensis]